MDAQIDDILHEAAVPRQSDIRRHAKCSIARNS